VGAIQTEETCNNIEQVIADAGCIGSSFHGIFRVYIRNPHDLPAVRRIHELRFGNAPTMYVQGDICRRELLVETEAAISWASPT